MMNIMFGCFGAKAVNNLFITQRAKGGYSHNLRLATSKESGTMCAGQQADFAADRAHFFEGTAVRANLFMGNHVSHDFFFQIMKRHGNFLIHFRIIYEEVFHGVSIDISDMGVAVQLVRVTGSGIQSVLGIFANSLFQFFRHGKEFRNALFLTASLLNFFLESYNAFDFLMAVQNGIENDVFRQFVSTGLYHHHGVFGTGNGEVQRGNLALFFRGVNDEFIIYTAYAHTGNRAHKGNIRHAQSGRRTNHGCQFRSVILLHRHNRSYYLHIVAVAFREQRTDRTVNQTGTENGVAGRTAFSFYKTTGNFAGSIHFFFVVNSQREKIHAFPGFSGRCGCNQNHRITITDKDSAISLFSQFAVFNGQLTAAQFHFKTLHIFASL